MQCVINIHFYLNFLLSQFLTMLARMVSSDPSASVSQVPETTDVHHHVLVEKI
jgi:hypothetical protein